MITNSATATRIDEVASGLYRISTPIPPSAVPPYGFSFNQYLVVDDEPLLFHAGPRRMAGLVREAITAVMPVQELRWIGISHVEADECGALNELLAAAPQAAPVCGRIGAMVSVEDLADRPPRALADGELLRTGRRELLWIDAPHFPHGWDCGYLYDRTAGTLLCGDLITQPGEATGPALTAGDVFTPSEQLRQGLDYFSGTRRAPELAEKLARLEPRLLACMHGYAWEGDGAALIRRLGQALGG